MTWHAKSTWRALQKRPRLYWAGAIRSVCHRIQKHNRQQHTHTHIYRQHARGRRASALCCCCCCSFSLSLLPHGMGAHHHSEQRERVGWRRKKKKQNKKRPSHRQHTLTHYSRRVVVSSLSLLFSTNLPTLFLCFVFLLLLSVFFRLFSVVLLRASW